MKPNREILVDYMSDREPGESIEFDNILFVRDDESVDVGQPNVDGASVKGTVKQHEKGDKITVLKFKRRNRYNRTIGHRQQYTRIQIDDIDA